MSKTKTNQDITVRGGLINVPSPTKSIQGDRPQPNTPRTKKDTTLRPDHQPTTTDDQVTAPPEVQPTEPDDTTEIPEELE